MRLEEQDIARQAFFNQRAHSWLDKFYKDPDTGDHDLHREKIRRILDTLEIEAAHHILDLGCGSGVLVPYLLERLGSRGQVVEMDYAGSMIEANMRSHTDPRIHFKCAHVMDMPFEKQTFDSVICFACFPHFQDKKTAVKQIARVLKTGGRLTISHLMSSEEIASHHNSETAVSHDHLPAIRHLEAWLLAQGIEVTRFTDEPGFYCLTATKSGNASFGNT